MEKLRRSLLFVPGSRPERFERACDAGADMVCIDLEDAVPPAGKEAARERTFEFLNTLVAGPLEIGVRVNAVQSPVGMVDLEALKKQGIKPNFVMLPKVNSSTEMEQATQFTDGVPLFPIIETARGLVNAVEIAAHPDVQCLLFGAVDFCAEMNCRLAWEPLLFARSTLATACVANDVRLFDAPYLNVKDVEGLIAETRHSKALGITARSAIHPAQIAPIHKALAPDEAEIEKARRVVEAFDSGKGEAALLDGELIELPVIKAARRILAVVAVMEKTR